MFLGDCGGSRECRCLGFAALVVSEEAVLGRSGGGDGTRGKNDTRYEYYNCQARLNFSKNTKCDIRFLILTLSSILD